jgi:class 3 adenylate cyclase/predicted ATPase
VTTIAEWLGLLGLSEHAPVFAENRIDDLSVLPDLSDQDLKEIGIPLGHRRKMLRAIAALHTAGPPAPFPAQDNAERRQVSVMFCDLVGSTELSTRIDPEDLREVIASYHGACREAIVRSGGFVARYMGDGILAYFGYPVAHEHDAESAVGAALAVIAAVTQLNAPDGTRLQVRAGIATGLVVVGDLIGEGAAREQTGVGETFNLAARLQTLAQPDTVVICGVTRRLVGELFEFHALGSTAIKGFADPVPVWQVTGVSAVHSRFEALHQTTTPLVDREEELELLMRRWHQAKCGDGRVVMIAGEPGIGKSRIVQTVVERLADEPHARLRYFCSPHHRNTPLYPFIMQLERKAGFRREDTVEQRLDKLEVVLAEADGDTRDVAPLFADLLSIPSSGRYPALNLPPARLKQRILAAELIQLEGQAARQPVLMVTEDVHWSDPTSLELLDLIIDRVPTLPVLLIVTFRPEFATPWAGRPQVTLLTLSRLPPQQRVAMIKHVVGGKTLPERIALQIMERTDGVPLFIEELTKAVVESGVLVEAGDRYTAKGPLPPLAIPTTLQASLLARLDRLAPVREVAQIAAAIGRQFSHELISAAARLPQPAVDVALMQLVDAELIFRRGTAPDAEYTFKHALVQDAAYQSLLRNKRHQYHFQIAQALEERFPEIVEARPQILAHHYTEADLKAKAIPYWQAAGQKAVQRSANAESIHHLTKGLELVRALPEGPERLQQELALLVALGTPLSATKGFGSPEVGSVYGRARELCRQAGGLRQLFPVLWGLWVFYTARAEHNIARELAQECHRLATDANDPELMIAAHHAFGVTLTSLGEFSSGLQHLEGAIGAYDSARHRSRALISGIACRSQAAWSLWFLGRPDQAREKNEEALSLAHKLSHPYSLAQASAFAAMLHQLLRDRQATVACAEATIALSKEHDFPFWMAMGMILRAWGVAEVNGDREPVFELQEGLAALRATGAEIMRPYFLALLAELHAEAGRPAEGLTALSEAQTAMEASSERCWEAELRRLKGDLLRKLPDGQSPGSDIQKDAEPCFREALTVARNQGAKSLELRAALRLGRLWQEQGKAAEARNMLDNVQRWFTEGFDTSDLKEAKLLLNELS